jgi:hypothetical protein
MKKDRINVERELQRAKNLAVGNKERIFMTFQAYIDNIKAKTGKTPEEFKKLAEKKGLLQSGVKAGVIVAWLKEDFGLGHGHAMAIYATFKGRTK